MFARPTLGNGRLGENRSSVVVFIAAWCFGVLVPLSGLFVVSFLTSQGVGFKFAPTVKAYVDILVGFRRDVIVRTFRLAAMITLIDLLLAFPFALWLDKWVKH